MADRAFTSEDEFFKETGLKDFSSVQVLKAGQTPTSQYYRYDTDPTVKQNAAFDPNAARYSELARQAGAAGVNLSDISQFLGTGLPEGTEDDIRNSLGIPGLEQQVFRPAPSTEQLFTEAFAAAGLGDLRKRIENLTGEKTKVKNQLQERMLAVNENPWMSEASRLTNIGNTKNFFEGTLGNLADEELTLQELYNSGLGQVNDLVLRKSTDFANQQAIDQAQLNYLLQKADSELKRREALEAGKIGRYLPEYLQARMRSTTPDTITTSDGAIYQWDRDTGQFLEIRGADPVPDPTDEWRSTPLSGAELQRFGVPAGTTWGEVQDAGLAPQKALSAEATKLQANTKSGLSALGTLKDELFGAGSAGTAIDDLSNVRSNILIRERSGMARTYKAAKQEIKDVLVRLRTGAAITENEEKFYEGMFPAPTDPEPTVKYKLKKLEELFNSIIPDRLNQMAAPDPDTLFQEFEGGPTSLKGKAPYLKTLGAITGLDGSSAWKWGLDVDGTKGDPLKSPVGGTVIAAATNGGFGLQVKIRSDDGRELWISHLDKATVKPGQKIAAGQVIGTVGNSGTVIKGKGGDGSHVDFTMPKGNGQYFTAREVKSYLDQQFV